jgi:transposase-like protein
VLTSRKRRNGAFPLARRGLRGVKLVVSEAHDGINAAVSNAALPSAQPAHGLPNLR